MIWSPVAIALIAFIAVVATLTTFYLVQCSVSALTHTNAPPRARAPRTPFTIN